MSGKYDEILAFAECNYVQNKQSRFERVEQRMSEITEDYSRRGQADSPDYVVALAKVRMDELEELIKGLVDDCISTFRATGQDWNDDIDDVIGEFAKQKFREEQHAIYQNMLVQLQRRGMRTKDATSKVLAYSIRALPYISTELRKQRALSRLGVFKKGTSMLDYEIRILERMSDHIGKGMATQELFPEQDFPERTMLQSVLLKYSDNKSIALLHTSGTPKEVDFIVPAHGCVDLLGDLRAKKTERAVGVGGISIGDVHAPVSIVIGNLNSSIAVMERRGGGDLAEVFRELQGIINASRLQEPEKIEALENLETAVHEVSKGKPNKGVIRASLDRLLEICGKVAAALPLLEKVGKMLGL